MLSFSPLPISLHKTRIKSVIFIIIKQTIFPFSDSSVLQADTESPTQRHLPNTVQTLSTARAAEIRGTRGAAAILKTDESVV